MEVIRKEDHIQLYVENRYFIIKNDIKIYGFPLPNLYNILYDKLISNDYTYQVYDNLYITVVLSNSKRTKQNKIECTEFFPYSDMNIIEKTKPEDLLKCIQCLKNKINKIERDRDSFENEVNCLRREDGYYS
jgi:hypothetical protein